MTSKKETIQNIYHVIFKRKKKDLIKLFLNATPGGLAAFFEGLTFALLLSSLYILSGRGIDVFEGKPVISTLTKISFLQELSQSSLFTLIVIAAITAQILKALIIYVSSTQAGKLAAKITTKMNENIYSHILSFDYSTVSNYKPGSLITYTQTPSTAIMPILQAVHRSFVQTFVLGILFIVLFTISVPLTLFFSGFFFISGLIYKKIISMIAKHSEGCTNKLHHYNNNIVQAISEIKLIHIFSMQKIILKRSRSIMKKMEEYQKKSALSQALLIASGEVFSMLMLAATIGIGSLFLIINSTHSLPLLLTYTVTAYRFTTVAREVITQLSLIVNHSGYVTKLNKILTLKDKKFESQSGKPAVPITRAIEFKNVSFQYPSKQTETLKNLTFDIPHNKMTAIVGLSGSGKSSIINLITRLFEPSDGKILVDGEQLENFNIQSWRSKLGVVSQNSAILNEPARENICFGTDASDEEILKVCDMAGCRSVIESLPHGLDSLLGNQGSRISGGEAQRISIARALIRNPDVMIFDEATSNLDSHNEKLIQNAIEKCRKESTLIIIAHRLSTITSADQIIVIRDGEVAEVGTHDMLIGQEAEYAHLWDLQSKKSDQAVLV